MSTEMKINFDKIQRDLLSKSIKNINKAMDVVESSIEEKSPVDTWDYIKWNKRIDAKLTWNKVVWELFNDSENAENVEFGWRTTEVNWYKWRKKWWPKIYTWVWARTYTRSYDEKQSEALKIIKELW